MPSLQPRTATAIVLIVGLLAAAIWLVGGRGDDPSSSEGNSGESGKRQSGAPAEAPPTKSAPRPASLPDDSPLAQALAGRATALAGAADAEEATRLLAELSAWLNSLAPEQAAAVVADYLAGGEDLTLPLEFAVGEGGALEAAPTLRVALLDQIGAIHPELAAAISREILAIPTSADEWALALRNVGRLERTESSDRYLREKAEQLLLNEAWQEKPSIGYLNAFDVLVHTHATDRLPLLSGMVQRKDRRDLAHASFLTLDRLTQREPVAMLEQLTSDRALQESRPEMVAQQFARADLRQPDQQRLVREWLLNPDRSQTELSSFAGVFPNNNRMLSKNLLTSDSPVSGDDLREHDRAVLEIVRAWQSDPSFAPIQPHLSVMTSRLESFVSPPQE